jgi:hypothetical protein
MPKCVLSCAKCNTEFTQAEVQTESPSSADPFTWPVSKPEFPAGGILIECLSGTNLFFDRLEPQKHARVGLHFNFKLFSTIPVRVPLPIVIGMLMPPLPVIILLSAVLLGEITIISMLLI